MAMISDEFGCRIVCGTCHKDIKDCCRPYYTATLENDLRKAKEDIEKLKEGIQSIRSETEEPGLYAELSALLQFGVSKSAEPCAACGGSGKKTLYDDGWTREYVINCHECRGGR